MLAVTRNSAILDDGISVHTGSTASNCVMAGVGPQCYQVLYMQWVKECAVITSVLHSSCFIVYFSMPYIEASFSV